MRIGEERAKGYEWEDFKEAFRRYIPRVELEAFKQELAEEKVMTEDKADAKAEQPAAG